MAPEISTESAVEDAFALEVAQKSFRVWILCLKDKL